MATFANAQYNYIVKDSYGVYETTPHATLNPSFGQTYVTWLNSDTVGQTPTFDFRVQLLDTLGNFLFPAEGKIINSNRISEFHIHYDTEVDNLNHLITATADERSGPGIFNIVSHSIDANGNFLWPDSGVRLMDSISLGGVDPEIGILSTNESIIVWNAQGISKDWISFQKLSTSGNLIWGNSPKRIIDSSGIANFSRPQVIRLANDEFLILYVSESGAPATYTIYAQKFNSDGDKLWVNPLLVSSRETDDRNYPAIVSDGYGGAYLSFLTLDTINHRPQGVYMQRVNSSGSLWSSDKVLTESLNPSNYYYSPILRFENVMQFPIVLFSVGGVMTVQSFDSTGNYILDPMGIAVLTQSMNDAPYDMRCVGNGIIIIYNSTYIGSNYFETVKIDFQGILQWNHYLFNWTSSHELYPYIYMTPAIQIPGSERSFIVWEGGMIDVGIYQWNLNADGTTQTMNIQNQSSTNSTSIYSNPSSQNQVIEIKSDYADDVIIKLYTLNGEIISSSNQIKINPGINKINLTDLIDVELTSGIYHITLSGQHIYSTIKLIKV